MTVSQVYALYCAGHAQAHIVAEVGARSDLSVNGAGLTCLERLILELALLDATNGTPIRSRRGFERALEQGGDVLRALGLRPDPEGERATAAPGLELDEAA
jgi:hypothetical protein